jgi:hypothetical protein
MAERGTQEFPSRLRVGYALDRLWRESIGLPPSDTKERPLRVVIGVLEATSTPYAVIGEVAMQLYSQEPRTTLDIDLAVRRFSEIPRDALATAGFTHDGKYAHSDNWRAPGAGPSAQRTAIQFSAEDVGIDAAVAGARVVDVGGFQLRLVSPADLLVLKLAAAEEPTRRAGKRRQNVLDIVTLVEQFPEAAAGLPELEERVERLTRALIRVDRG